MPIRFRKSIKLFPGVRVNLSERGVRSVSAGIRGTGLSYVHPINTVSSARPYFWTVLVLVLLLAASCSAFAKGGCYVNPATDAYTCYSNVTERGGLRYADLHSGGPRGTRDTGFQFVVDCTSRVMHLKDRDGVSFAAGSTTSTEASSYISGWICAAPVKAQKTKVDCSRGVKAGICAAKS